MEMTIDIDKSIKELSKWRKRLNYDNGDYCYGDNTTKYSLDVAITTMRKYQQIVGIVSLNDEEFKQCGLKELKEILEVIADGDDD